MMVQMFQDGILKLNHLLFDELFKWKNDTHELRVVKYHMPFWSVIRKEMCCWWIMLRLQEGRDVDQP
jgi:hypothetical protein